MTRLQALREEIARLMGSRPSLKRARQKDFLLVMFGPDSAAPLEAAGYEVIPLGDRRWGIEPPRAFYQWKGVGPAPAWQPGYGYQLYRMVKSHPQDDSLEAARALAKAIEAGEAEACCRQLMIACAQRLRQHRPLPGHLEPWLMEHLEGRTKSAE